jgi:hypothetical protein
LVTEAILSWVRNQPEAEICEATDTAGEWDNLLADLEKQVTIQSELLRELHVHFGVPYIGNDPTHGGQSNDGTCVVNARARNASAGTWMVDCQPHKVK